MVSSTSMCTRYDYFTMVEPKRPNFCNEERNHRSHLLESSCFTPTLLRIYNDEDFSFIVAIHNAMWFHEYPTACNRIINYNGELYSAKTVKVEWPFPVMRIIFYIFIMLVCELIICGNFSDGLLQLPPLLLLGLLGFSSLNALFSQSLSSYKLQLFLTKTMFVEKQHDNTKPLVAQLEY